MGREPREEIVVVHGMFDAFRELLCETDGEDMLAHQMGLAHQDCKRESRAGAIARYVRRPTQTGEDAVRRGGPKDFVVASPPWGPVLEHTLAVDKVQRSQERRVREQRTQLVDSLLEAILVDRAHDGLHEVSQTRGGRHYAFDVRCGNLFKLPVTRSEFGNSRRSESLVEMAPYDYLFVFAQAHEEFRIPELRSIAELHGFRIGFDHYTTKDLANAVKRPFMILQLEEGEHAKLLVSRCILIKSIYEFYAQGSTYDELHEANRRARSLWERYIPDTSFKFTVIGYNHGLSQRRQRNVIESFSYMGFLGKIEMKNPEITLGVFEEYEDDRRNVDGEFKQAYFGRLVAEGTARSLIRMFDVKKRAYFGNTSMEAEISLLMANQTQAAPGKLVYDPFIGTGSMAYTTAYFGAHVYGSDIDGRQMRGKGKTPGIIRAAAQYGVAQRIIDLCTFDVTRHPWRCGGLFDAIITDPPYGVRAGAKRLGRKKRRDDRPLPQIPRPDPNEPYIPPTKPYELSALIADLILFARYQLKPRGLLVFFLPTVTETYEEVDVQAALCEGMELVANSVQGFGSWGRRLITIRKATTASYPPSTFDSAGINDAGGLRAPAHKDFREKYFQGFKKESEQ